ncbi:MAG: GTP cyclohydrolase I FolE [Fibromonadaceae bacterium]|jgi:GTP cyclohydrolase I|nr:GTP cyclohydrolase I FolE [Fibromonadaceae bacterium]
MNLKKIEDGFRLILEGLGENPDREGLRKTPERVAKMYAELLSGLSCEDKEEDILATQFTEKSDDMILLKDIPVTSFCEHHFLPFTGVAHVAYIPSNNRVVGLSKLARTVDFYASRPQIQERLTTQIAELIHRSLQPQGVGVVLECTHTCTTIRGVKKTGSVMFTSKLIGAFKSKATTRAEFMALIGKR